MRVFLCVREGKQRAQRVLDYVSPLASISETEESDCGEGAEPKGAERSANSATGSVNVSDVKWV